MPTATMTDSKHALLCATERLYVEVGPSVSLREIAQAAGQRNNSAVNYHFGSRTGVESAVLRYRTMAMEERRAVSLGELGEGATIHELVAVLVDPLLTVPTEQGATHYARFAEVVRTFPSMQAQLADKDLWGVSRRISGRIVRLMETERVVSWRRMEAMTTTLFALVADREHALAVGAEPLGGEELTRLLVGLLRG